MASSGGVNKISTGNTKGKKTHLPEMLERDKEGHLTPGFMERVAAQTSISQGRHSLDNPADTYDRGQLDDNGLIDQANSLLPLDSLVVKSIERDNTPMYDAGTGSRSNGHECPLAAGHS